MSELKSRRNIIRSIFVGKRYDDFTDINDRARYMTMNGVFMVAIVPLVILGIIALGNGDMVRTYIDFGIAFLALVSLLVMRTRVPLNAIPITTVTAFGSYCVFLLSSGDLNLWAGVWIFAFPPISIFLCQLTVGLIYSVLVIASAGIVMYFPLMQNPPDNPISIRIIIGYMLVLALTIVYEQISKVKSRMEERLKGELASERDVIQTMKDNIPQGVFMIDRDLKIQSQYSKPLVNILSYYDSELTGKNFLDILSGSLDAKQLQTMKGYFNMIFEKTKSTKLLETVNPISEFEYKIDDRIKHLSTKFYLIEQVKSDPVIIGLIMDITKDWEYLEKLQAQKEIKDQEIKDLYDVVQIDPLVFRNFIEDMESDFDSITANMKNTKMSEREMVTKFFQTIHAIKANAAVLGIESFGKRLHVMEDDVKAVLALDQISGDSILSLAIKLESLVQEKDKYLTILKKIDSFKAYHKMDSVLANSLSKIIEKTCAETGKRAELKSGEVDVTVLESKLRKPIKDILFQCARNSIYHGIEPAAERVRKQKTPHGLLKFSIVKNGDKINVTFSDDGAGLDWKKIGKKYLEKNPGAGNLLSIPKNKLLSLIFSPEFSTAEETTVSAGRGVGLSLVRDLVKENNGTIQVDSKETGTVFRFSFPLAS